MFLQGNYSKSLFLLLLELTLLNGTFIGIPWIDLIAISYFQNKCWFMVGYVLKNRSFHRNKYTILYLKNSHMLTRVHAFVEL